MKQAAEQAKVFENSLMILSRTIKKNELTVKQLEKIPAERAVYVPLGKAYVFVYASQIPEEKQGLNHQGNRQCLNQTRRNLQRHGKKSKTFR